MANGPLDMASPLPTDPQQNIAANTPQQQALRAGFVPVQRGNPMQGPQGFQGQSMPQLSQMYGLLAGTSDDPERLMNSYVNAVQNQQRLDRQNSPLEQYMRIYGAVNPHDWSADSLQKFHNHLVQTGEIRHELLEPKESISAFEDKVINEAINKAQDVQLRMYRANNMASKFDDAAMQGIRGGVFASAEDWLRAQFSEEREYSELRRDFDNLIQMSLLEVLPPGVASDIDVQIAQKGFPPSNASPEVIARFLRGMVKLEAYELARARHTAAFVSTNESQAHLLSDWENNKERLMYEALAPLGGTYAPTDQNGVPLSIDAVLAMDAARNAAGPAPPSVPYTGSGQPVYDPQVIDNADTADIVDELLRDD